MCETHNNEKKIKIISHSIETIDTTHNGQVKRNDNNITKN